MSLNRCEQMLFDYWARHVDEKRHWETKVREAMRGEIDHVRAARLLERELWSYFEERSGQVEPFKGAAARHGLGRVSLQNLSEYLVRIWGPPAKPKRGP